jgi:hypothetical protein
MFSNKRSDGGPATTISLSTDVRDFVALGRPEPAFLGAVPIGITFKAGTGGAPPFRPFHSLRAACPGASSQENPSRHQLSRYQLLLTGAGPRGVRDIARMVPVQCAAPPLFAGTEAGPTIGTLRNALSFSVVLCYMVKWTLPKYGVEHSGRWDDRARSTGAASASSFSRAGVQASGTSLQGRGTAAAHLRHAIL